MLVVLRGRPYDRRMGSRRLVIGLALLVGGFAGWFFLGGSLFVVLTIVGLGLLLAGWLSGGANDMYGSRTEYPVADDLVRADDAGEQRPHPGPLPPQPPGW
jgi:hypothetical protein